MSVFDGVRVESISLGAGRVSWRVVLPPMRRKPEGLVLEHSQRRAACEAVKRHFTREEVDPEILPLVEEGCPDLPWKQGNGR